MTYFSYLSMLVVLFYYWEIDHEPCEKKRFSGLSAELIFQCQLRHLRKVYMSGSLAEFFSWSTAYVSVRHRFWRDCAEAQAPEPLCIVYAIMWNITDVFQWRCSLFYPIFIFYSTDFLLTSVHHMSNYSQLHFERLSHVFLNSSVLFAKHLKYAPILWHLRSLPMLFVIQISCLYHRDESN